MFSLNKFEINDNVEFSYNQGEKVYGKVIEKNLFNIGIIRDDDKSIVYFNSFNSSAYNLQKIESKQLSDNCKKKKLSPEEKRRIDLELLNFHQELMKQYS